VRGKLSEFLKLRNVWGIGLGLMLLMGIAPVSAQDVALPDVEALFTDAANVTFVQPIPDSANDQIYFYEEGEWQAVENPEPANEVVRWELSIHENFEFTEYPYYAIFLSDAYGLLFNLVDPVSAQTEIVGYENGRFVHTFSNACGTVTWIPIPENVSYLQIPLETRWRLSEPASEPDEWRLFRQGEDIFFCHKQTGELVGPVPEYLDDFSLNISPDGRYALLFDGLSVGESIQDVPVLSGYSFNFETGDWLYLGDFEFYPAYYQLFQWISETDFLYLTRESFEWTTNDTIVGDVSQVNSIREGPSTLRIPPFITYDPPGLEANYAARNDSGGIGPCYEGFYDAGQNSLYNVRLDDMCEYGLPIGDGSGDHLFRRPGSLVRRNLVTGAQRTIYRGSFERLGPVSPSGQWGLLEVDTDGEMSLGIDDSEQINYIPSHRFQIVNLNDGTMIGEIPDDVFWLDATTLFSTTTAYQIDAETNQIDVFPLAGIVEAAAGDIGLVLVKADDQSVWLYSNQSLDQPVQLINAPEQGKIRLTLVNDEGIQNRIRVFWTDVPEVATAYVFELTLPGNWGLPAYVEHLVYGWTRYN
jgi:hypothetical protein